MNFIYCRRVYIAYKKEKSKRKVSKLLLVSNFSLVIYLIKIDIKVFQKIYDLSLITFPH